ncbi:hypothetical protein VTG60DRAFT_4198 [Thermothelomyces hinnuleus]
MAKLQRRFFFLLSLRYLAWAQNSDSPKNCDRLEFTAGMGGLKALFRHIALRQTGSLYLSHLWCDPRLLMAMGSGSVCSSTSRHCLRQPPLLTRFGSSVRIGGTEWMGAASVRLPFSLCAFTPQRHITYHDGPATAAYFISGGSPSVVGMIR